MRPSGDTTSPTLALVVPSINTLKKRKGKKKNESSPINTITLDEFIEMPKWDLSNFAFEKTVILQDILAERKGKKR